MIPRIDIPGPNLVTREATLQWVSATPGTTTVTTTPVDSRTVQHTAPTPGTVYRLGGRIRALSTGAGTNNGQVLYEVRLTKANVQRVVVTKTPLVRGVWTDIDVPGLVKDAGDTSFEIQLRLYTTGDGANAETSGLSLRDVAETDALPLRLEIEDPTVPGEPNLIVNPSGELGGWGWVTPVPGSSLNGGGRLNYSAPYNLSSGDRDWFHTEAFAVIPNNYVAVKFEGLRLNNGFRVALDWLDDSLTLIESTILATYAPGYDGQTYYGHRPTPRQAPTGARWARLVFEVGTRTGTYPRGGGGGGPSLAIRDVVAGTGITASAATQAMDNTRPVVWRNILGPTHEIGINREDLSVGTLTATIFDAELDPATGNALRPGGQTRLTVWDAEAFAFEPIFTGETTSLDVTYDLRRADPSKAAKISLSALDPVQRLANASRPQGVAKLADLPVVLEGAGVPWNVDGNTDQIAAAVITRNESASALDQISITRDSTHGYAWVDRRGVFQARSALPTTASVTLDEDDYSDIVVTFSDDECINEITLTLLRVNLATGETVEVPYGPYRLGDSIAQWGIHSKNFVVQGVDEYDDALRFWASKVFAVNGWPRVRVQSADTPIRSAADLVKAHVDLNDTRRVVNANKSMDEVMRVTGVSHSIRADDKGGTWIVGHKFGTVGAVAAPQVTPPIQNMVGVAGTASIPAVSPFTSEAVVTRVGNVAYLTGAFARPSGNSTSYAAGGIVPEGFRPASLITLPAAVFFNDSVQFQVRIHPTGVVEIRSNGPKNFAMGVMATWPVVD